MPMQLSWQSSGLKIRVSLVRTRSSAPNLFQLGKSEFQLLTFRIVWCKISYSSRKFLFNIRILFGNLPQFRFSRFKFRHTIIYCPDGGMVDTLVLETSAERRGSSSLPWGTNHCECGGMVYTADLKSAAYGLEGSNPSSRTSLLGQQLNGKAGDS